MDIVVHNLARTWRPKQFEEIVGQQLIIRILKNSLYKAHYFPAYLFSGQRGCGKTSTARVFAAALNCFQLSAFQKDPKNNTLPCSHCASCVAMKAGSHPDFFEIDAASNTGVEHIRALIEASALCPVMGGKKIYLIDEVHMLSKSAFNAFLKLLEEPPASVFFILATTDQHKVPETVQSRCFILQFRPIDQAQTTDYLTYLCQKEELRYHPDGLALIARSSEGSMRDAVNILEQVRFAAAEITVDAVRAILGHIDDQTILLLVESVIQGQGERVLVHLRTAADNGASADYMWKRLKSCVRTVWWASHGLSIRDFAACKNQLRTIACIQNRPRLVQLTELLCLHELAFKRSSERYIMLELILLRMCTSTTLKEPERGESGASEIAGPSEFRDELELEEELEDKKEQLDEIVAVMRAIDDPLVQSVMAQATDASYDVQTGLVTFVFPANRPFFSDLLEQTMHVWKPVLQKLFGNEVRVKWEFTGVAVQNSVPRINGSAGETIRAHEPRRLESEPQSSKSTKSNGVLQTTPGRGRMPAKKGSSAFGGRSSGGVYTLEQAYALRCQTLKKVSKQVLQDIPQIAALIVKFPGIVYQMHEVKT